MTKQEFEKRIGWEASVEEYTEIEQEYMAIPDEINIYKDEFCKIWKEAHFAHMNFFPYLVLVLKRQNDCLARELKGEKYLYRAVAEELKTVLNRKQEVVA